MTHREEILVTLLGLLFCKPWKQSFQKHHKQPINTSLTKRNMQIY